MCDLYFFMNLKTNYYQMHDQIRIVTQLQLLFNVYTYTLIGHDLVYEITSGNMSDQGWGSEGGGVLTGVE